MCYNTSMQAITQAFADPIIHALPKIPQTLLALLAGWLVIRVSQYLLKRILKLARTPRTLLNIITSILDVVLWMALIAVIFQNLGLTQIAFAISGSVAIIGVAVGSGANSLVQDVIAGLFLSRDPDFDEGYTIKTGDIEGVITAIDMRKVRIQDKKGQMIVLPTSSLDKNSWTVLSKNSN